MSSEHALVCKQARLPFALGCAQLGLVDMGNVDLVEAKRAVRHAYDRGVTIFDTADVYGLGRSETELADALGSVRNDAFIITKFGVRWAKTESSGRAKTFRDCSPAYLEQALEHSLKRLRVEAIPLYLVHWPDHRTPIDELVSALERYRSAGKLIHYGLSNFSLEDIRTAMRFGTVDAYEGAFSLVELNNNRTLFEDLGRLGLSVLTYGALAQGLLSGTMTPDTKFGDNDNRQRLPQFTAGRWEANAVLLGCLHEIAARRGVPSVQVAIRWVLDGKGVDATVVGAKSVTQLDANLGALDWKLDPEELRLLNRAHSDYRSACQVLASAS